MAGGFDPTPYREEFPVTDSWTYLNHAAHGPYPRRTAEAVSNYAHAWMNPAAYDAAQNEQVLRETREGIAELAGGSADHVAFVGSLAEGMNLLANGLEWQAGDNLIMPGHEFPSVVYPFLNLERLGVEVRFIERNAEGRTDLASIEQAIDDRTRAVTISHVEWLDGYRNDLAALGTLCRDRGIELFVDATQSLGVQPIDLEQTGVTAIAAHGYKWLLGSFGTGVVVFNQGAMDRIYPTYVGRLSVASELEGDGWSLDLKESAERYQTGGLNMQSLIGLHASLSLVREVSPQRASGWTHHLTDCLAEGLEQAGYQVISDRSPEHRSQILTFSSGDEVQNQSIAEQLVAANISVVLRGGSIRVSPYFYNTTEDIERLLEHLPAR